MHLERKHELARKLEYKRGGPKSGQEGVKKGNLRIEHTNGWAFLAHRGDDLRETTAIPVSESFHRTATSPLRFPPSTIAL